MEVSNKNMVRDWSAYSEACEEQHDLITALLYRNLDHIALEIFEYLDTFGLTSVAAVCTTWSAFIGNKIFADKVLKQDTIQRRISINHQE